MRPLEERFPTLYHHISEERDAESGKIVEKRVAKGNPPTLRDVVSHVLGTHGVHSAGALATDIASAVREFIGGTTGAKAEPERGRESRARTRADEE